MIVSRKTQDLDRYEPKLIGPFTIKKLIIVGIGAVAVTIVYSLLSALKLDSYVCVAGGIVVAAPFAILAFWKPYGMDPLQYLRSFYEYSFLSTKERIYHAPTLDQDQQYVLHPKNNTPKHKKEKNIKEYE